MARETIFLSTFQTFLPVIAFSLYSGNVFLKQSVHSGCKKRIGLVEKYSFIQALLKFLKFGGGNFIKSNLIPARGN